MGLLSGPDSAARDELNGPNFDYAYVSQWTESGALVLFGGPFQGPLSRGARLAEADEDF
jgi:hypothetical protein